MAERHGYTFLKILLKFFVFIVVIFAIAYFGECSINVVQTVVSNG